MGNFYNSNQANSSKVDDSMGLSFQFNKQDLKNNELISRVGISFISTDKACANIEDENFDFDSMVQQNQQQWKNEVFQKFEIQHDNQTVVDQFYTNLYGIHLLPSNRTGENQIGIIRTILFIMMISLLFGIHSEH